jgi:hypothetical protein
MSALTLRERRLVAVAILVGLVALVWLAIIAPIVEGFAAREAKRAELLRLQAQNERTIARIPALRRAAEALQRQQAGLIMPAPNGDAAGELLRERLGAAIETVGGELRASESGAGKAGWTRAVATGLLTPDQLVAVLDRLLRERPMLVIDAVTAIADRALVTGKPDAMDVRIEASAPYSNAR